MKSKVFLTYLVISITISPIIISCNRTKAEEKSFDYFGQTSPGDTAVVFASGTISVEGVHEGAMTISSDGDEVFFVRGTWPYAKIMHMTRSGGSWSLPDTAEFSEDCWATEPVFSPDGRYLYFSTSMGKSNIKDYNLWRIKKTKDGWSEPVSLFDVGGESVWEFHPTISNDGSLYFCWWDTLLQAGDIYLSQCSDQGCSEPVKIDVLNSDASDADPYIDPDGTYMIFASMRPGGYGLHDHYISFKKSDGSWTSPENMGSKINSEKEDYDMDLSPDGKYIFLYLNGDIYWKEAGDLIESYRK